MNNCNFIGRLTKDPEAKRAASGKAYCNFSIAIDRGYKDSQGNKITDFIPCVAWDNTANLITQYFTKGNLIGINGRMESRSYDDKGTKRTTYSILVISIDFIQGKSESKPNNKDDIEPNPYIDAEEVPFDI